jgi:hypothetical protein
VLDRTHHDTWIDQRIVPAQDWWHTIPENIENCELFIYVMTPKSVESIYNRSKVHVWSLPMSGAPAAETLLDEITDFLASIPTADQIVAFKPSEGLNDRLHELLDRAGEGELMESEQKELDEFLRINHMLKMLKGKVRLKLAGLV